MKLRHAFELLPHVVVI